ncbi:MAG TPA: cyclic nucleotide-binding domain-containing protein [Candidatus Acidoferrales bacterium]|nr:cyclic nucleotide-binding domain-containing protein [Candidatus Acidoferrales bacterium]
MASSKVEQLRRVPVFAGCTLGELKFLATQMDEAELPGSKTLIAEGRDNDTFYVVLQGELEVLVHGKPRRRLGPGDFFGEISMTDRGPATATVVTRSPVRALVLSHSQFRAIRGNDLVKAKVLEAMAQRLASDRLADPG